jgi:hypothetical protein
MPVVAVVPAIFAGVQIATVGIAAMSTMAVISAVGAIAAGIGAVTGNKALMQIGGIASLAGGIGQFAQGQGWLSGDLAAGADATMANAGANATPEISNTSQMIAEAAPGVVDPSAANYTNQMDLASDAATAGAGGSAAEAMAGVSANAGGGLINSEALSPIAMQDVGSFGNVASVTAGPTSTSSSIFGTLKDVGSFMKDNKELASLGMNFLGGMFDDKKKAETGQINAATGLYQARTDSERLQQEQMRQQAANANAVPDITGLRVRQGQVYNTGPAPVYQAPKAGLINSTGR